MPIPDGVARITLVGHLPGGETFETGLWISRTDDLNTDDMASAIAASWDAHHGGMCHLIGNTCGYDELLMYDYPDGGPDAATVSSVALTGGVGTNTSGEANDVLCAVFTLMTARSGRSYRGRMFLPACGEGEVNGLFETNVDITAAQDDLVAWFNGINGLGTGARVVVMSEHLGITTPVTNVKTTDKPGTQRRRAKSVNPAHRETVALA